MRPRLKQRRNGAASASSPQVKTNQSSDHGLLLSRQFPVQLAVAMTVSKAQSVTRMGVDLWMLAFASGHGQLYVAFLWVTSWQNVWFSSLQIPMGMARRMWSIGTYFCGRPMFGCPAMTDMSLFSCLFDFCRTYFCSVLCYLGSNCQWVKVTGHSD